ncbi:mitotic-spindle organizing protein 1-like [Frankliniella occidentalis]|uniref:Mitotic-spindle organizing protein 1-like n=1 Tax=Frankliniella occidentalis TaxID=133901 RepID=A0A9C6U2Y5_FRAOC|nr:mitotic-spindle organizing protein 1-like [Frankliniella occidentalis]
MADGSDSLRAREALALLSRISKLLNTGLDTESLSICIRLCEAGVHPEALAKAIQEVRREVNAIKNPTNVDEDSVARQLL